MKTLTEKELEQISEKCTEIELIELKTGGWKYLSGGFARCDMVDYCDDTIYLDLTYGVQSDCEDRVYTDHLELDRETMEEI